MFPNIFQTQLNAYICLFSGLPACLSMLFTPVFISNNKAHLCASRMLVQWLIALISHLGIIFFFNLTRSLLALFFFKNFIFNWRVIALQCCVGFCHTSTWIRHRHTYVLSLLNVPRTSHHIPPHPTPFYWARVSQSTWFELLALYSKFTLAVLHMVIHMFKCYSVCASHPLLPSLCPQVCSLCLHLLRCPANRFIHTIFLDSINMC